MRLSLLLLALPLLAQQVDTPQITDKDARQFLELKSHGLELIQAKQQALVQFDNEINNVQVALNRLLAELRTKYNCDACVFDNKGNLVKPANDKIRTPVTSQ